MLTFLPIEEIEAMEKWEGAELNKAKEILGFELTKLVHGEEEAKKAQDASRALFAGGGEADNVPSYQLLESDLRDGAADILTLLVASGLTKTRSEARQSVLQGGVTADGEKVTDIKRSWTPERLPEEGLLLRKGKKSYCRIVK